MKLWELLAAGLRKEVTVSKQQYDFKLRKSSTDVTFAFRVFMVKFGEGQMEFATQLLS